MSLDLQQFRIGNLIQSDGEVFAIDSVSRNPDNSVVISAGALHVYPAGLELDLVIPLTPEWLERAGFKITQVYEQVNEWFLKPLSIQTDYDIYMVTRIGVDDLELKYVHQLQNLYFALTGQELVFNPKH